jgi:hypothetical protein
VVQAGQVFEDHKDNVGVKAKTLSAENMAEVATIVMQLVVDSVTSNLNVAEKELRNTVAKVQAQAVGPVKVDVEGRAVAAMRVRLAVVEAQAVALVQVVEDLLRAVNAMPVPVDQVEDRAVVAMPVRLAVVEAQAVVLDQVEDRAVVAMPARLAAVEAQAVVLDQVEEDLLMVMRVQVGEVPVQAAIVMQVHVDAVQA